MNKQQFIESLKKELTMNKAQNIEDILSDYEEHFAGALEAGKSEEQIIKALGSPAEIAQNYAGTTLVDDKVDAVAVQKEQGSNSQEVEQISQQINMQLQNLGNKKEAPRKKNDAGTMKVIKSAIIFLSLLVTYFLASIAICLVLLNIKNPSLDLCFKKDYLMDGSVAIGIKNDSLYDYENVSVAVDYMVEIDGRMMPVSSRVNHESFKADSSGYEYIDIPLTSANVEVQKVTVIIDGYDYEIYTEIKMYDMRDDLTAICVTMISLGLVCGAIIAVLIGEYEKLKKARLA